MTDTSMLKPPVGRVNQYLLPETPSIRRCRFLEEVEQGTSQILISAANILESLGLRSAESMITGGEGGSVSDNNPEDMHEVMREIEKFEASVKQVCSILHEQIDNTPTPHRANCVPYLDALDYENKMEAEYIECEAANAERPAAV